MGNLRPDGLTVVIIRLCRYGHPGEVKTISYSTAEQLVVRGYAKIFDGPIPGVSSNLNLEHRRLHGVTGVGAVPAHLDYSLKVSAICPTYNRRRYLPTSISLFLAQTLGSSELIIVDDSTESVRDLVPNHPRIRYTRLDTRMSTGNKRNLCCEQARGEYIVHWDDDDWQAPNRLEDQVSKLHASGKSVLWYNNILYYNEEKQFACRCFPANIGRAPHGATFCYRREWWDQHKFVDCFVGEDTGFGKAALAAQQASFADAGQMIVVRAHGKADSPTDRGNTCDTQDGMKSYSIPEVPVSQIPPAFFEPLLSAVPQPLVLLAICGWSHGAVNGEHQAARETFLQDVKQFPNLTYKFFIGDGTATREDETALNASLRRDRREGYRVTAPLTLEHLNEDEVLLHVPDDYQHLSYKSREIHRWAIAHGFDYIFLCYPDTAVDVTRLMRSGFENNDYVGRPLVNPTLYAKGGQGRWLSRRAAKFVASSTVTDWAEDRWVGAIMLRNSIALHKDNRYVDYPEMPRSGNDYISSHLSESGVSSEKVAALQHEVYATRNEKLDVVMSVVRNHTWSQIAPYANSLVHSGFSGLKLMFVDGVDAAALTHLHALGFKTIPFHTEDPARFVTRDRFVPVVAHMNAHCHEYRYAVWTDVRDVVFQSDPCAWLEKNLSPHRLLGCSECVLVKSDPTGYNAIWLNNSFANDAEGHATVWDNDVICGGTIAGDAEAMRDLLRGIYELTCRSVNDQTALQYLMRRSPFKEVSRIPKNSDGFCATLSWQCGAGKEKLGHALTDDCVFFDTASVQVMTPDRRTPFAIVHQYDRDGWWSQAYTRKFSR